MEDINAIRARKYADAGQLSRAIAALDSTGIAKGTKAEEILDLHPQGDDMSIEDWHRAEQHYENLGDRQWPTEPTEKMTHSIYYILRDLDQHSSGSISGLLNSGQEGLENRATPSRITPRYMD
jgi:hypothetical protein